jgi:cytochrome c
MKNALRLSAAGLCAAGLLIPLSFVHPFGNARGASAPSGQVLEGANIPSQLVDLVERKCGDCHSEQVEWPVYSRIAPFSWLVERDILEARRHMNLSRWELYSSADKIDRLSRLASEARSGQMPPARYTAVHRASKLTPEEKQSLYAWARAERRRLRTEGQEEEGR